MRECVHKEIYPNSYSETTPEKICRTDRVGTVATDHFAFCPIKRLKIRFRRRWPLRWLLRGVGLKWYIPRVIYTIIPGARGQSIDEHYDRMSLYPGHRIIILFQYFTVYQLIAEYEAYFCKRRVKREKTERVFLLLSSSRCDVLMLPPRVPPVKCHIWLLFS